MEGEDYTIVNPSRRIHFIKSFYPIILIDLIAVTVEILALTSQNQSANLIPVSAFLFLTAIVTVISGLYTMLFCKSTSFALESDQLVVTTGILRNKRKVITLDKVQDSSLERGVMDKLLGGARLNVRTAGSGSYEVSLSDLEYGRAKNMHQRILEKMRARSGNRPSTMRTRKTDAEFKG